MPDRALQARALRTIADRMVDDRDLVGFKLALLAAALALVAFHG